jgi:histidinol-phosphate aminotransferase
MARFRDNIINMRAYVPGEQPQPGEKVIKLNTNENPYPPSPKAMAAMRDFDGERLRLYSHPMAREFRAVVAEVLGLPVEWIMPGNGSDDVLGMICRACAGPGDTVAFPMPSYTYYRTLAAVQGAACAETPFDDDYRLPADALAAANAAVTFVASPNSPSGTGFATAELDALAGRVRGLLVIDEAYADFADENAMDLVRRRQNVVVLRTMSKGYSLAGLRLGFGVARPEVLAQLAKVKDHYNVSSVACLVGAAAVADQAYLAACVAKVRASRAALTSELERMGFRVWPSQSNFLLAQPPSAPGARKVYEALKAKGILIRYFNEPRLDDKLRISVGADEQNAALVAALQETANT